MSYDGILLCDKPYGVSSHDVIGQLRRSIGQKRIGHTGTLDPRATGLLLICLGRATKIAQFMDDHTKVYRAEITLGRSSRTMDAEGIDDLMAPQPVPDLSERQILEILAGFKGIIRQKVPAYSAVKVGGRRLYEMARKNEIFDTPEKQVEITDIKLLEAALSVLTIEVTCSRGTYIRSLANDIGEKIGCGAYLSNLCRLKSGRFSLDDALTLKQIQLLREAGTLKRYIVPIETALGVPGIKVDEKFAPSVISGRSPRLRDIREIIGVFDREDMIALLDSAGRIMAVGRAMAASIELNDSFQGDQFFKYVRVLN
jgi:tRNA pseudouridine55 synthase